MASRPPQLDSSARQKSLQPAIRKFFAQPWVEITVGLLVIVSVILTLIEFALESNLWLSNGQWEPWVTPYGTFDERHLNGLALMNFSITLIFVVELTFRFMGASSKKRFFKEFWLDIVATLPVFRVFRGSRALRLLRLVRLIRLTGVFARLSSHYPKIFRAGAIDFLMISGLLVMAIVFGTVAMLHFEGGDVGSVPFSDVALDQGDEQRLEESEGLANSFWFSLYTLFAGEPIPSTPQTVWGKFVAIALMFMGMTIFAIFTGTVSAFMVDRIRTEGRVVECDDLDGHVIVCGWTPKTEIIIQEYRAAKATQKVPIVVITELEKSELDCDMSKYPNLVVVTDDFTRVSALERAGIERAKTCIVLADSHGGRSEQDSDARTILASLTVEKLAPDVYTCAELLNRNYASHLEMGHVNDFVVSQEYGAYMLAQAALNRGLAGVMSELLTYKRGNEFYRAIVPNSWEGTKFDDKLIELKSSQNAILIGVLTSDGEQVINPTNYLFQRNDEIIAIADGDLKL